MTSAVNTEMADFRARKNVNQWKKQQQQQTYEAKPLYMFGR